MRDPHRPSPVEPRPIAFSPSTHTPGGAPLAAVPHPSPRLGRPAGWSPAQSPPSSPHPGRAWPVATLLSLRVAASSSFQKENTGASVYSTSHRGCDPRRASPEPRQMSRELQKEFQRLALPHLGAVHDVALRLTQSRSDAKDLTQDTYLRAFASFGCFERGSSVRAWLFT